MIKKILTVSLLILAVLIFFFGGRNKNSDNELVFWTLQLGTFDKYINGVIKEFEELNPDIKIKWVDVPYSEGEKRTLAALLSDNPPDLINLTPDFSALAAQRGALFEIPEKEMENYPQSLYDSLSYNGKFYAIPFYLTSAVTYANKKLMQEGKIYSVPTTYDEMYSQSSKIKLLKNTYTDMPALTENDTFLKILIKNDIDILSEKEKDKLISIYKDYRKYYLEGYIPKESLSQGHREALEKYMSGQIVFLQAGANFLNIIKENAPEVYANTEISYQLTGNSGKYDFSVMNFIIPLKAKQKENALKFAMFITNEKNQLEFAKLTSVLPANKYALKNPYFNQKNTKEEKARFISALQINNLGKIFNETENKKNIINLLNTTTGRILSENKNVENIVSDYYKDLEKIK